MGKDTKETLISLYLTKKLNRVMFFKHEVKYTPRKEDRLFTLQNIYFCLLKVVWMKNGCSDKQIYSLMELSLKWTFRLQN